MNTITRTETAALAEAPAYNPPTPAAGSTSSIALLMDDRSMDKLIRVADMMASARATVPKHFRGNPGDCLAVCMQAATWNMNPFAVAQKTFLVGDSGTLGYEAQLVSAVINNSGAVKDRFHFEWFGPWEKVVGKFTVKRNDKGQEYRLPGWTMADEAGCGIRVWATIKGESEPRELELLLAQARVRNSTLWADDPKQQLAYLAQKRWARLYAPDVILGVYTPDEFEQPAQVDMGKADEVQPVGITPEFIARAEAEAAKGLTNYRAFYKDRISKAERNALQSSKADYDRLIEMAKAADAARTVDAAPAFPPADEPVPQPAGKSFEEVMQMLCDAKTEEALFVAADWISGDDQEQVRLLDAKFQERLAQIRGEA